VNDQPALLAAGDFVPDVHPELLVSADELALQSSERCLFDARAPERYRGDVEPIDPVAGHIPGAQNLPFAENLENGRFRSPAELRARLARALGEHQPEQAIVYCGSGVTACHDVLAFAHAGLPLPKLYAGSWSEWITDPARGIEKG
jgi:thiosulfate/3-mercaptopyruvate sulfurtransferase